MKGKATEVNEDRARVEPELEVSPGYDDMTPECFACGESHVGVGSPVYMIVPGMMFPNRSYDIASFVPDPDAKLVTLQMPNGQLAYVTDHSTVKYAHAECIDTLIDEAGNVFEEEEEEEEEDE
jgi:hypothetical protein